MSRRPSHVARAVWGAHASGRGLGRRLLCRARDSEIHGKDGEGGSGIYQDPVRHGDSHCPVPYALRDLVELLRIPFRAENLPGPLLSAPRRLRRSVAASQGARESCKVWLWLCLWCVVAWVSLDIDALACMREGGWRDVDELAASACRLTVNVSGPLGEGERGGVCGQMQGEGEDAGAREGGRKRGRDRIGSRSGLRGTVIRCGEATLVRTVDMEQPR